MSCLRAAERADGAPAQCNTEGSARRAAGPGPEGEAARCGDGAVNSRHATRRAQTRQTACE